ncbi:hypothetical protein [Myroides sp. WP-1]|uniref:hypothetical protein n=1 Tax=Myroides sp. WP-1 TaxID=2759944 RepID=UPI0015FB5F1E|nr:hypothetical protein [Myroides sp. WP-1]MBB1140548.1 hypothetical protein [Myroides sp. WP-1]
MNKPPQSQFQVINSDQHNLMLLHMLYEHNACFESYAKSINELFYYYVQHCTENGNDLFLTSTDIQQILEVVHTLQQLKEPLVELQFKE